MNPIKRIEEVHFIHISKRNYAKTEGCIAIKKRSLKIIKNLTSKSLVKIFEPKIELPI